VSDLVELTCVLLFFISNKFFTFAFGLNIFVS